MNRIVEILCRRDGITVEEATRLVNETKEMIADIGFNYDEAEQIMQANLGLEMDYICDLLF